MRFGRFGLASRGLRRRRRGTLGWALGLGSPGLLVLIFESLAFHLHREIPFGTFAVAVNFGFEAVDCVGHFDRLLNGLFDEFLGSSGDENVDGVAELFMSLKKSQTILLKRSLMEAVIY